MKKPFLIIVGTIALLAVIFLITNFSGGQLTIVLFVITALFVVIVWLEKKGFNVFGIKWVGIDLLFKKEPPAPLVENTESARGAVFEDIHIETPNNRQAFKNSAPDTRITKLSVKKNEGAVDHNVSINGGYIHIDKGAIVDFDNVDLEITKLKNSSSPATFNNVDIKEYKK